MRQEDCAGKVQLRTSGVARDGSAGAARRISRFPGISPCCVA